MNTFAFTFLIFLLHSGGGDEEGTYGEYLQSTCDSKNRAFAVSMILVPAESEVQMSCGGSLISLKWSLTVAKCIHELFKQRTQRAVTRRSLSQVYVTAGFDKKTDSFRHRPVKRYVDPKTQPVLANMKRSLSLVELEIPFEPLPNLIPAFIPKDPLKKLHSCRGPETVSIVRVPKPPAEIPTTPPVAPSPKKPVGSDFSTEYIIERICRSVKIVQDAECACELVDLTPETTTSKPSADPYQICGLTKVPGQSENHKIIEAQNEPKTEFHKPISNMSSCVNSIGSPLICDGGLLAIVNHCHRGGARGDTAETSFTSIEPYLDFIAETIGDPSIKSDKKETKNKDADKKETKNKDADKKATVEKSTTSGADTFKGDGGKVNLLAGIEIFFCFFVCAHAIKVFN